MKSMWMTIRRIITSVIFESASLCAFKYFVPGAAEGISYFSMVAYGFIITTAWVAVGAALGLLSVVLNMWIGLAED